MAEPASPHAEKDRIAYTWTPNDRADHEAGHPSGYDCDGYAIMPPHEVCGQVFPSEKTGDADA